MDVRNTEVLPPPPGILASLQAGFNVVSNRVGLILIPVALNLFLWLGPRLSVGKLYEEFLTNWVELLRSNNLPEQELSIYTENMPILVDAFNRLHWLSWIRTLPIGVPALMLDLPEKFPVQTPLGLQPVIQFSSPLFLLLSIPALSVLGWLLGGWYFRLVAAASLGEEEAGISLMRAWAQTILLSLAWSVGWVVLLIPLVLVVGFLGAVSPVVAQIFFFVALFFSFWLIVPLFFTPHGIFVKRQNAFRSVMSSLRLSRFTLPTSSLFVLSVFLLSRGLSYLWRVPENDSWLALVGITGHGFISTALLAASFVYYRDMNEWLDTVYERFLQVGGRSPAKKI